MTGVLRIEDRRADFFGLYCGTQSFFLITGGRNLKQLLISEGKKLAEEKRKKGCNKH